MAEDAICRKCGTSWNVPKKLKEVLSEAQSRKPKAYDELLSRLPEMQAPGLCRADDRKGSEEGSEKLACSPATGGGTESR